MHDGHNEYQAHTYIEGAVAPVSSCPFIHLSIRPSISLSVHPSVYLYIRLSVHPSVCLSIHPSVCLFVCLFCVRIARPGACLCVRLYAHPCAMSMYIYPSVLPVHVPVPASAFPPVCLSVHAGHLAAHTPPPCTIHIDMPQSPKPGPASLLIFKINMCGWGLEALVDCIASRACEPQNPKPACSKSSPPRPVMMHWDILLALCIA